MWITSFRYIRIIFHLTVSPIISPLTSHSVFPTCTTFFSRSSFSPNSSLSLLPLLSKFSPQNRTKQRAPRCSREAFPREPFFFLLPNVEDRFGADAACREANLFFPVRPRQSVEKRLCEWFAIRQVDGEEKLSKFCDRRELIFLFVCWR